MLRHGPMIAHILDTAITCTGPQDPRLFTLLENDQMAQVLRQNGNMFKDKFDLSGSTSRI